MKVTLDDGAYMPVRAHELDAGWDLRSPIDRTIPARGSAIFNTGVHIAIPAGHVGMIKSKSGLNVHYDLVSEGVVDAGYTGAIVVKLYNNSDFPRYITKGAKISQIVIMPISTETMELAEELPETERGSNGFGSTGR